MSSTAAPGSPTDERRKSIGKYVKRLSSVWRRGSSSKSVPTTETAGSQPRGTTTTTTTTKREPAKSEAPVKTAEVKKPEQPKPIMYGRTTVQQERARALFEKYGLTLEPHEWITSPPINVQRVEKPIRMRVHRTCHRCNTTFGPDRICAKCEHKRCKKCPRYPPKKPKDAGATAGGAAAAAKGKGKEGAAADATKKKRHQPLLTITSKTGGELIYHPPRQRIHRTCHKCHTEFVPPTATQCTNCHHIRCTKCPRDPAKLAKWPHGYPGDAPAEPEPVRHVPERVWKKPRRRVRWTCENCSALFKDGMKTCPQCQHQRCQTCKRDPPKKPKKEFDPEVVKRVEEKLAAMSLTSSPPTST